MTDTEKNGNGNGKSGTEGEYKKRDSAASFTMWNARLAVDARIIKEGFAKLTVCCTSAAEADDDLWVTIIPFERDFELAQHLRKGDLLGFTGFPTQNTWGDNNMRDFTIKFPKLFYAPELVVELKKRAGEKTSVVVKKVRAKAAKTIINIDDEEVQS